MDSRMKNLCSRAKKADKNAACQLLEIYHYEIYTYLKRLCGNRQDAEDLTQQTFLKVWTSLDDFSWRSTFSTWLYRIAYNTYIDWQRKVTHIEQDYPDPWWDECINANPGPLANIVERQIAQHLYEAIEQLDDDKKHVIHLHYYQGLSIRQTAKVLNIANSTVKYRLREVLKILRIRLDVHEREPNEEQIISAEKGESL